MVFARTMAEAATPATACPASQAVSARPVSTRVTRVRVAMAPHVRGSRQLATTACARSATQGPTVS
jgi:hypothetical protein